MELQHSLKIKLMIFGFGILAGCKPTDLLRSGGYIIGPTNDIVPINQKVSQEIPDEVMNASVLIATEIGPGNTKFCSGVLIEAPESPELKVLTNHHCFSEVTDESTVSPNWLPQACSRTKVYFGFKVDASSSVAESECKKGSLVSDPVGDIAVFALTESPPKKFKPLNFWNPDTELPPTRSALVVHYPDVASNFVPINGGKVRLPAASLTVENCDTMGMFPRQEWHLSESLPFAIRHSCDIVSGSSGSALVDKETLTIIGVNWGGIELKYPERSEVYNAATRSDYIIAFLTGELQGYREKMNLNLRDDDERHTRNSSQDVQRAERSLGSRIKKASCGVLGDHSSGHSSWFLVLFLSMPIMAVGWRSRIC